ncbi:A/G-specific adenine glycosylase [Candidatus Uabimicrobium sp. HlEnr_7]|uniref:A/G-specific adenine glycosylase n=1 Tax=Candidatus Uabimicrobium helgolandensis TaxID=3095367 RepID=UPI003556291F
MNKSISKHTLEKLLQWFLQVREDYFFRKQRNPYRVWVSEVVLQQTRIQAALEPLERFFSHFPDVKSLADATEEKVVYEFRGLGYYSRARNLRKGAIYITQFFDGKLPESYDKLLQIPSIGPYTAAAIASICFELPYPVCDGNVKRILLRANKWSLTTRDPNVDSKCISQLKKLYKGLPAGNVNEAIMELGQKICTRTKPKCTICPIQDSCKAFAQGVVNKYPLIPKKKPKVDVNWHLFIVVHNNKVLLQKWNNFYFLKKQKSFPSILDFPTTKKQECSWETKKRQINKFIKKYSAKPLPSLKHSITKHRIVIFPYIIFSSCWEEVKNSNSLVWVSEQQAEKQLVSSALSKIWKLYQQSEILESSHDKNT